MEGLEKKAREGSKVASIKLCVVRDDLIRGKQVKPFVIDGQHRRHAMILLKSKYPHLPFTFHADIEIVEREADISALVQQYQNTLQVRRGSPPSLHAPVFHH